jgi:hypothetical protein
MKPSTAHMRRMRANPEYRAAESERERERRATVKTEKLEAELMAANKILAIFTTWPLREGLIAGRDGLPDDPKKSSEWRDGWRIGRKQRASV